SALGRGYRLDHHWLWYFARLCRPSPGAYWRRPVNLADGGYYWSGAGAGVNSWYLTLGHYHDGSIIAGNAAQRRRAFFVFIIHPVNSGGRWFKNPGIKPVAVAGGLAGADYWCCPVSRERLVVYLLFPRLY